MFEAFLIVGWLATVLGFLFYLDRREAAVAKDRARLLSRIQAPRAAPFLEDSDDAEPQYLPYEDDEAFQREMEKGREALAEVSYHEEEG